MSVFGDVLTGCIMKSQSSNSDNIHQALRVFSWNNDLQIFQMAEYKEKVKEWQ